LWKLLEGSPTEWLQFGCALAGIIVLVWLIVRIRLWFREDEGPAADAHEMLLQFRDLHRRGDLSEEEFRSIKSRLLGTTDESGRGAGNSRKEQGPRPNWRRQADVHRGDGLARCGSDV